MAHLGSASIPDRLKAAAGAIALQIGLVYALIVGLNVDIAAVSGRILKVYDLAIDPPPPPPEVQPERARTQEEEGAAAPPNLRAKPTPVVAPPTPIPVPR